MEQITNTACTGAKGDGKIFISNIEESTDICSKEKGIHTL
jgi:nitrogen regulatory protein PII